MIKQKVTTGKAAKRRIKQRVTTGQAAKRLSRK